MLDVNPDVVASFDKRGVDPLDGRLLVPLVLHIAENKMSAAWKRSERQKRDGLLHRGSAANGKQLRPDLGCSAAA